MNPKRKIPHGSLVAVDTEGTGLMWRHGDQAFAISIANTDGQLGYFEWPVDPHTRTVLYDEKELQTLRSWFADENIRKVFHNAPYDMGILAAGAGCIVRGAIEDTSISVHCVNSALPSYELKWLARLFHIMDTDDEKELKAEVIKCRLQAKKLGYSIHEHLEADYWLPRVMGLGNEKVKAYACNDVLRTIGLWAMCETKFERDPQIAETYRFEMQELFPILQRMSERGVWFNPSRNDEEIAKYSEQAHRHMTTLRKISGRDDFNADSAPQVRDLLFNKLGFVPKRFTPKGFPEASADALMAYRNRPEAQALFEYRAAAKGLSSFFQKYDLYKVRSGDGWCVHPNVRQGGKKTGRLSMANPPLQGTSDPETSRSDYAIDARGPFGPRPGYSWFLIDYSQLEVRIFAAFAGPGVLQDSLLSGRDMHSEYTNRVWGGRNNPKAIEAAVHALDLSKDKPGNDEVAKLWKKYGWTGKGKGFAEFVVDPWLADFDYDIVKAEKSVEKKNSRSKGKEVFFSRMFWVGAETLSEYIDCDYFEAKQFIREFDEFFPEIIGYLRRAQREADKCGYTETAYGRKLRFSPNESYKAASYRVQGTAADLIKRAMVDVDEIFRRENLDAHILLQIHDELILEIRNDHISKPLLQEIKWAMECHEDVVGFPMPVKFERAVETWSKKEPVSWLNA